MNYHNSSQAIQSSHSCKKILSSYPGTFLLVNFLFNFQETCKEFFSSSSCPPCCSVTVPQLPILTEQRHPPTSHSLPFFIPIPLTSLQAVSFLVLCSIYTCQVLSFSLCRKFKHVCICEMNNISSIAWKEK